MLSPRRASSRRLLVALGLCGISLLSGLNPLQDATADSGSDGRITAKEVRAFAAAVNLRPSDLPNARVESPLGVVEPKRKRFTECVGLPALAEPVARVKTRLFVSSLREAFSSSAEALPTPGQNQSAYEQVNSRKGFACYREIVIDELRRFRAGGVRIRKPALHRLSLKLPAGSPGFAFRLRYLLDRGQYRGVPVYTDIISVLPKSISFALVATREFRPPSRGKEARLISLLYDRASRADS